MLYPEQRYLSELTIIRRDCRLPDEAIGTINVTEGKRVEVRDVVAHGVVPSRYIILNAMKFFKLRKPEALTPLLQVEEGDVVDPKHVLAGKDVKRGKRLFSDVRAVVAQIADGRIILQEMPEVIDLEAGVRGRVISIEAGRGALIEAVGAQLQGAWGNGKLSIATLRVEPEGGIEGIIGSNTLETRYMGSVLLTRKAITLNTLRILSEQNVSGVIAPSMDAHLVSRAMKVDYPVFLTEGFGNLRMTNSVYQLLNQFEGIPITLDAFHANRWSNRRPEVIINVKMREGQNPARPNVMLGFRVGMTVRVTRAPYEGQTGQIVELPVNPVLLDNGLRILCARVELTIGETLFIPRANLEVLGR
ncbi:MAG: hypothetical protein SFZ02_09490 [bacterium]|nr:hypothetical protein [bacterium]